MSDPFRESFAIAQNERYANWLFLSQLKVSQMNRLILFGAAVTLACSPCLTDSARAIDVVVGGDVIEVEKTLPDADDLWVTPQDFTRINGFELKPEGACYKDLCVPLKQDADNDLFVNRDGQPWLNVSKFAGKVQQSFVADHQLNVWSFGMVPSSRRSFLDSAIAPDFELKDRNGDLVKLSDFRGKKVMIITWASW